MKYSADFSVDMDKEFIFQNFPELQKENNPECGVDSAYDAVFQMLDLDALCYLLSAEGTHMVLFGGVWSEATHKVIAKINCLAKKHGVSNIHMFDFSADGTAEATIKQDLTAQETYDGPDKKESNPFAIYNYLYGEIVRQHLTNLNDWVARKANTKDDITFLDLYQEAVSVPDLKEPFLFIFNKDNTVDNSGCHTESGTYPVMWAAELDADGDIDAQLEEKIFCHVGENGVTIDTYGSSDYIREAFRMNKRGHSFKTQDAFNDTEQINVEKLCFQELHWLVQQEGSFLIMLAGPWCAYSQGGVATVNDFAVANNVRVYMSDIRLDSKHAIDFWMYARRNELTISCPPMRKYYIELWEEYFKDAEVLASAVTKSKWGGKSTVDYTDENGVEHSVLGVGVPYILAYNKDNPGRGNHTRPVLASHHDAGELINCSREFIYHEPNYRWFTGAMYRVFYNLMDSMGKPMHNITIDRTQPLVEGEPVRHKETEFHTKEHNWYVERADRV